MATSRGKLPDFDIIIQRRVTAKRLPSPLCVRRWAHEVLKDRVKAAEITVRIVTPKEMTSLNTAFRHKPYPTNVLSFLLSEKGKDPLTGDLVICAAVVAREAREQTKPLKAHWAHMVVHGLLHLIGFDHEKEKEAREMESEEIRILDSLGFANPYDMGGEPSSCSR